jgi:hypothetical protein
MRPETRNLSPSIFPVEAFAKDDFTDSTRPILRLISPWRLGLSLTEYPSNLLAIAGGLAVGDLYRNGDAVCIVH